ncbi:type IV toxin-antitoxin system AbiEi family antitoxin domain-containing protein [Methanomassiliicoccus luminyensis]|jgi:predicted transcriptional regulator of viral defense system|uniref:type IV toxin-antitoxin system AbiEi family antitoxin domain-containing protein n=1 Tax=Methanomassiliicoccus luminyensis TaxID=1080712 RepID=UPI0011CAC93E|nr:hypothetical protein [Methanomassiliicoccus luminyensis]
MRTSVIWDRLNLNNVRFVSRETLDQYARELGKNPADSMKYLQRHGYIHRVLRGFFYVSDYKDLDRGGFEYSLQEMISEAMKVKNVKKWYFGLESALKLNLMTHEHFNIDYVITDSFRTTKTIEILKRPVRFYSWSGRIHIDGSLKQYRSKHGITIPYSDVEKTVLDLAYKTYIGRSGNVIDPVLEYREECDPMKLRSYLMEYPPAFREMVGEPR